MFFEISDTQSSNVVLEQSSQNQLEVENIAEKEKKCSLRKEHNNKATPLKTDWYNLFCFVLFCFCNIAAKRFE